MKHGIRKIKFTKGQDAHQMLVKKLLYNFFTHGSLVSTEKKIKALKPLVDKITYEAQKDPGKSRGLLQRYFSSEKTMHQVLAVLSEKPKVAGSVTRILKLNRRESDGAQMSQLQWVTQTQAPLEKSQAEEAPRTETKEAKANKTEKTKKTVQKKADNTPVPKKEEVETTDKKETKIKSQKS